MQQALWMVRPFLWLVAILVQPMRAATTPRPARWCSTQPAIRGQQEHAWLKHEEQAVGEAKTATLSSTLQCIG